MCNRIMFENMGCRTDFNHRQYVLNILRFSFKVKAAILNNLSL